MAIAAFMAGDMDGARSAHVCRQYTPVFAKGPAAAGAGYQYSRVQKDAWAKLRVWLDAEEGRRQGGPWQASLNAFDLLHVFRSFAQVIE